MPNDTDGMQPASGQPRHQVAAEGEGWRCVDCDVWFPTWPPDTEPCPMPREGRAIGHCHLCRGVLPPKVIMLIIDGSDAIEFCSDVCADRFQVAMEARRHGQRIEAARV